MTTYTDELRQVLAAQPMPVCAKLLESELLEADAATGHVRLQFSPQPAFGNHFGHIQAGFIVAMLDAPLSLAAYIKLGRWVPTIEIKTSYIAPAPIGINIAEGIVLRAGKNVVYTEAKLWTPEGKLLAHATATALSVER